MLEFFTFLDHSDWTFVLAALLVIILFLGPDAYFWLRDKWRK